MKQILLLKNHSPVKMPLFLLLGLMFFATGLVLGQGIRVSGTVTEGEGESGIVGATVQIKDTNRGTVTDFDGKYSIEVTGPESVLVFSYIGYEAQEITVGNQSIINVSLTPSEEVLSEVIVTALGVERETKALGYAVQAVDGDRFTEARESNVINSLSGRVAGVQITNSSSGIGGS